MKKGRWEPLGEEERRRVQSPERNLTEGWMAMEWIGRRGAGTDEGDVKECEGDVKEMNWNSGAS